jgi:hypothetical protein
MEIEKLKTVIQEKLNERDYYGAFVFIDNLSDEFLTAKSNDYKLCIELITQNQEIYEFMGASKEFEMAFDLHNKIIKNRNRLFLSCFSENQSELKGLFKKCVGDNSTDY